jgi:Protein of unknown function (DUF1580)
MIDLSSETAISLSQVAKLMPPGRGNKPMHVSAVLRWILRGAKDPQGRYVRLAAARVGGKWITSREALQRFSESLTPQLDQPAVPAVRTPTQRERAQSRAAKTLAAAGIK